MIPVTIAGVPDSPDLDAPDIGLTYARNQRSPTRRRVLGAFMKTVQRLRLARPLVFTFLRLARFWSPTTRYDAFAGYTPTARDVFVCTYAKSGTNLLLHMVHRIAHGGGGDFQHIHDVAPWPEAPHPTGASLHEPAPEDAPFRAIKSHLEAEYVPLAPAARYIVVVRDPLDALVSGYHFALSIARGVLDLEISRQEWIELCLRDGLPFGSWAGHTASWWPLRDRDNVLLLTFREAARALEPTTRRVADFLGASLDDEQLARVLDRCSFGWMKAHDAAFRPPFEPLPGRARSVMVRRGAVGEKADFFAPDDRARLTRFFACELARRGSDFPLQRLLDHAPLDASPS